jgi:hypothetical protein
MTDYSIKITKADNGFICEWEDEDDEGNPVSFKEVFEEKEFDNDAELKCTESMLWHVKDYFGMFWSKHNKKNLKICVWDMSKDKEVDEE